MEIDFEKYKGKKIIMVYHSSPSIDYETYDLNNEGELEDFIKDLDRELKNYGNTIYISIIGEKIEFDHDLESYKLIQ